MFLSTSLALKCNRILLSQANTAQYIMALRNASKGCMKESVKCEKQTIRKTPCVDNKPEKSTAKKPIEIPFISAWGPSCNKAPCPDPMPKFDELFYKPSDKAARKYQQTWVECPKQRIVQKIICEYPKEAYPPLERRPRKKPSEPSKCVSADSAKLMACSKGKDKQNKNCLKITLPGCRSVRDPPKCKTTRGPSNCKKIRCPYPSYSECAKPKIKPRRPAECECLNLRSMCEVWTVLRAKTVVS